MNLHCGGIRFERTSGLSGLQGCDRECWSVETTLFCVCVCVCVLLPLVGHCTPPAPHSARDMDLSVSGSHMASASRLVVAGAGAQALLVVRLDRAERESLSFGQRTRRTGALERSGVRRTKEEDARGGATAARRHKTSQSTAGRSQHTETATSVIMASGRTAILARKLPQSSCSCLTCLPAPRTLGQRRADEWRICPLSPRRA